MMWLWVLLASLALVLVALAVLAPPGRRRARFRLYIWAASPDGNGSRDWHYQVRDEHHPRGGRVVTSGVCVSWRRALEDGLHQRSAAEQTVGHMRRWADGLDTHPGEEEA